MREVNFSIPNVNKASVGITTALYDRRALDCTSTLPLINSLNHLAYLTTSSARIRDILTVDGGVERLVCILKAGRSKDMMEMWKWNLAFQCVVNIGVRGSENVRTRVVEADMVPVIATMLDNYLQVVDKCREKAEAEMKRKGNHAQANVGTHVSRSRAGSSFTNRTEVNGSGNSEHRSSRRQAPPPSIEIPAPPSLGHRVTDPSAMDITPALPQFAVTSPPERTTFNAVRPGHHHNYHHYHPHHHPDRHHVLSLQPTGPGRFATAQPLTTAMPSMDRADGFGLRPVRDVDRLPSMVPGYPPGVTSQPESPTTPHPLPQIQSPTVLPLSATLNRVRRRPSIRHQRSMSAESDDGNGDDGASDGSEATITALEPLVGIRAGEMDDRDAMLASGDATIDLTTANPSEAQDLDTFNITHRSAVDGSIIAPGPNPTGTPLTISREPRTMQQMANPGSMIPSASFSRYLALDRPGASGILVAMPRDEDVLMSLQLLAYVSKYCNLRAYFQNSHLVPKLKIGNELDLIDGNKQDAPTEEEPEEEYLVPNDYNIFPLVERFTPKHHSGDMQYWAGVVMRNLCRKDDARGGIRQCAYYQCGKWEEYTRQFAKCRRCRRTKYCSKECQKNAWAYHRHWCVAAQP
ncbi:MAG: hypothetical protein M1816_007109 [Peltula sp. TS41687]|nr:MAG: hypothetical protein M1816_007109 [Peltula sp. TS41687]